MRLWAVLVLAVTASVTAPAGTTTSGQSEASHPAVHAAIEFFAAEAPDFAGLLRRLRPAPLPRPFRDRVLGVLPRDGELKPRARDAAKLAALGRVLAWHEREHELEMRLFSVSGQAFIGLHAQFVLLISREALDILQPGELEALAAHEMGHLYFWDDYEEARRRSDRRRLQELELRCDGVAVVTLHALGAPVESLVSAVNKITRHNERVGATATSSNYVPLPDRVRFIRAMQQLIDSR